MPHDSADRVFCEDMLRHADYGIAFVQGMTYEQFIADLRTRFAVERVIEIIGEAANKLSPDAKSQLPAIPWRSVVAQRHVLAHHYGVIDYERLWEVAVHHLQQMKLELHRALQVVDSDEDYP
jgi:uncharacterized protein with HEPN domain